VKSPFLYTDDNKRYHTYNYYLRHRYGTKVFKVGLDAGFTCPNRDGTRGIGGCVFCNAIGSGDFGGNRLDPLVAQFEQGCAMMRKKWPDGKAIAYFQSFTNTYASLAVIKERFQPIFDREDVLALSIATRPDALSDDVLEYLAFLNQTKEVWIELGLQSIHDATAVSMNRGHTYAEFLATYQRIRATDLKIAIHLLNGLPGESIDQMLESARAIGQLKPDGVKIHMLNVLDATTLAKQYESDPFPLLSMDEYVELVVRQLEVLPPTTVIQRLTGDGDPKDLIAPVWTLKKTIVLNSIDQAMKRHDTWQGSKLTL